MKIRHIQEGIEEGLAGLATSALPPGLEGLRKLPVSDRNPQVSIRYVDNGRKVREDAAASYFDPDRCEVVIRFVQFASPREEGELQEVGSPRPDAEADTLDIEEALDQLVSELGRIERTRQFVGLKWFRDQVLSQCEYGWVRDPAVRRSVLRSATHQRLVLTSHVPNPVHPHYPVTAVRVNRRHARFRPEGVHRRPAFTPVRIRGGSLADTVLGQRR